MYVVPCTAACAASVLLIIGLLALGETVSILAGTLETWRVFGAMAKQEWRVSKAEATCIQEKWQSKGFEFQ